ncbi:hypothetical protein [Thiocapsa rosea]|uniref:hypothetical protein n=1 Tax=Thiocapsa rosea TaxID=69360 RepID=UPI000EAD23B5|nr:hypothetical protein [Thiocapsa rosea]
MFEPGRALILQRFNDEDLRLEAQEINRTLVHGLGCVVRAPALVETSVRLGHALQIRVTAIGIETEAEFGVRDLPQRPSTEIRPSAALSPAPILAADGGAVSPVHGFAALGYRGFRGRGQRADVLVGNSDAGSHAAAGPHHWAATLVR